MKSRQQSRGQSLHRHHHHSIESHIYLIFKRCPSLSKALCDLFNSCWSLSAVPSQWKVAAIKLIRKSSAEDDLTTPGNFCPNCSHPMHWEVVHHYSSQLAALILDQQSLPRLFHSKGIHVNHPRLCRASAETGSHPCRRPRRSISRLQCAGLTWLMLMGVCTIHSSSLHSNTTMLLLSSVKSLKPSIPDFQPKLSQQTGQLLLSPFRLVCTKVIHCQ